MAQRREARPHFDFDFGEKRFENGPYCVGAEQQSFRRAAAIQEPIGENMSALWISTKLDLINRDEAHPAFTRHGLNGAGEPACLARDDFLLSRYQRNVRDPFCRHELLVIFAREQAQREPDHSIGMSHEALQREPGFTGIRRSEEGGQAAFGGA